MKIKIKKTWIVIIIIILLIVGYYVLKAVFKDPFEGYVIEQIGKGEVSQEISETGSVRATEDIVLGFKSSGKISKINVAVGDDVLKGSILAELDVSQAYAQLQSAQAALEGAQKNYDKLIAGSGANNGVAIESRKIALETAYSDALVSLESARVKSYTALSDASTLQNTYFTDFSHDAREAKIQIQNALDLLESSLNKAKSSGSQADIDSAVSNAINSLNTISGGLKIFRDTLDDVYYYGRVPDSERTELDTQMAAVNTILTTLIGDQQAISSAKISLLQSQPEIDSAYAQVQQAQANVNLYQSLVSDNYIRSPINGKITSVNMKAGQISSAQASIGMLSSEPFQIKAAIYEQDIINVQVGDDVKINLVAFPKENFYGKVMEIDPAETIIDNVVYYQIKIDFPDQPEGLRSGMTADIMVQANKKENVLRVQKQAVVRIDGTESVQIIKGKKIEDKVIVTGLEGNDYYEIVSGLDEGDKVVAGKK